MLRGRGWGSPCKLPGVPGKKCRALVVTIFDLPIYSVGLYNLSHTEQSYMHVYFEVSFASEAYSRELVQDLFLRRTLTVTV